MTRSGASSRRHPRRRSRLHSRRQSSKRARRSHPSRHATRFRSGYDPKEREAVSSLIKLSESMMDEPVDTLNAITDKITNLKVIEWIKEGREYVYKHVIRLNNNTILTTLVKNFSNVTDAQEFALKRTEMTVYNFIINYAMLADTIFNLWKGLMFKALYDKGRIPPDTQLESIACLHADLKSAKFGVKAGGYIYVFVVREEDDYIYFLGQRKK